MTSELVERLRAANPVPAVWLGTDDDDLLRRILATPRAVERPQRFATRRLLVALVVGVIVVGSVAAAFSRFVPEYFGSDDREPPSAVVLAQLRSFTKAEQGPPGGLGQIDAEGLVRVAAFDTENGRATIYAAPLRAGDGFCYVGAIDEELSGGGCKEGPDPNPVPYVGHGSSQWGDVRVIHGRLEPLAAGIEVRFEDGAVRDASVRAPWWTYVVGGDEVEPGHRPVELAALDSDGTVVATQALDPSYYTSEEAVEALPLPESDGSPGQNAIRAVLEQLGASAEAALPVEIDRTRLLRQIETPDGTLNAYTAPGRNGVCYAAVHSRLSFVGGFGCPYEPEPVPRRAAFEIDPSLISEVAPSIFALEGAPPTGAARVEIRFEDGSTRPADIVVPSAFVAWLGPERLAPGHWPTALVAFDDDGRKLDRFPLDTRQFRP
jgi:hypothetical protein